MDIQYRASNKSAEELQFVAEIDTRIPMEYDPHFEWSESSVLKRIADYNLLKVTDFFQLATDGEKIIGFHIIRESDYLNHTMGNVVTLWVDPKFRNKGIAKKLKELGEAWGKKRKVKFIQTAVHVKNEFMLKLNKQSNFEETYKLLRKYL